MELPVKLQNRIIKFLESLPNIHEAEWQRALIYKAGLDSELQDQISFNKPPSLFFPSLVRILTKYGTLKDNGTLKDKRNALEAVLETAKNYIGQEGKKECEMLIEEIHSHMCNTSEINIPNLTENTIETRQNVPLNKIKEQEDSTLGQSHIQQAEKECDGNNRDENSRIDKKYQHRKETILNILNALKFSVMTILQYPPLTSFLSILVTLFSLFLSLFVTFFNILFLICSVLASFDEYRSVSDIFTWDELDVGGKWLRNNPFTLGRIGAILVVLFLLYCYLKICWTKRHDLKDLNHIIHLVIYLVFSINIIFMVVLFVLLKEWGNYRDCLELFL